MIVSCQSNLRIIFYKLKLDTVGYEKDLRISM